MRKIDLIVVHCAASKGDVSAETIRQWHLDRGWRDIGYHYLIRTAGNLEMGRPIEQVGAHVRGHNSTSIGICLAGGFGGVFDATDDQMTTLEILIRGLLSKYPDCEVSGHNDYDLGKTCPNFDVPAWWQKLNA